MTAALAPYDDLTTLDVLTGSQLEGLRDEELLTLLLARFRSFLACGCGVTESLLLAVGYGTADVAFVAEAVTAEPSRVH